VDEELICTICSDVLDNPAQSPCEHAFCTDCIARWMSGDFKNYCPVDLKAFTPSQLQPAPRLMKNLLAKLEIACEYASQGCQVLVRMEDLPDHVKECRFNSKRPTTCDKGCGVTRPNDEMKDHNCVKELTSMVNQLEVKLAEMQREQNRLKPVYFHARRSTAFLPQTSSSNIPANILTYDPSTETNSPLCMNSGRGAFIAPVDGVYSFSFTAPTHQDHKSCGVVLYHQYRLTTTARPVTSAFQDNVKGGNYRISLSSVVKLSKSDIIFVVVYQGGLFADEQNHIHFHGVSMVRD